MEENLNPVQSAPFTYVRVNVTSIYALNWTSKPRRLAILRADTNIIEHVCYIIQYVSLVQRFSLTLTLRCSGQELASDSAGEPLFLPGEAVPLHDPGLRDTLCAFSPQRHGYTMKSLNPGLVGIRDSAALGLMGVVLITDTRTLFGESLQNTAWCLLSAIANSVPLKPFR